MKGFDRRLLFPALLLVALCAGCSQTNYRTTPDSALPRLGRGDVGTGETIASPQPGSSVPPYYQEIGGGFRKQYCESRADIGSTGS